MCGGSVQPAAPWEIHPAGDKFYITAFVSVQAVSMDLQRLSTWLEKDFKRCNGKFSHSVTTCGGHWY